MTTTTTQSTRHAAGLALGAAALLLSAAGMAGCRGDRTDKPPPQFFPDMDQQPKLKPQSETQFFEDGRSQRPLVERSVPFGSHAVAADSVASDAWSGMIQADRDRMLKADETFSFGLVKGSTMAEPEYVDYMPVEMTGELLARGKERFDIYCSACHGYTGHGGEEGTVGRLWSYAPANLMSDLYRDRSTFQGKDGYLFHVIREGLWRPDGGNRMPAYKHAINEQDAWAVVAYMRALQAAQGVPFDQLDPADQARLETTGGNP